MKNQSAGRAAALALVVAAGMALPAVAEEQVPAIEDFAFMAGHWRGEGFGATVEEVWSEPMAGTMMGSFRLVKDGKTEFYELMVLGPDAEGFSLKVKHFSTDFSAWEERADAVRFGLEKVEGHRADFKGLKFVRDGDVLTIEIRMKRDGEARWETLSFRSYEPN